MSGGTVQEPARKVPVIGEYEICVLGGGPAGIAAAWAAARHGRTTLLVERYGFLGGMGTAAGVTNFCGLYANVFGTSRRVVHGVATELLSRIDRLGGLNAPHLILGKTYGQAYDTAAYKCAADDLLHSRNVEVLFRAWGAGALVEGDAISALLVETKSGRRAVRSRIFIDCSGDGDLSVWAGAPCELGDGRGNMLFPSTMFRLNGVDPDAAREAWSRIPEIMDEAERRGTYRFPRKGAIVRPQKNTSEWRVNVTQVRDAHGRAVDGTNARELSDGEIEGRRQVIAYHDFLRREVPGFARSYIIDIAPQLGIRETRRVTGKYQLTGADVTGCASFPDTIGVNGWPLEKHVAGDVEWGWPDIPGSRGFNHLPYRMLVPERIPNLLVAGRCASMDHDGQSAARVTGACLVMGQAAGTAAHLALTANVRPEAIPVERLQAMLEGDGAYLGRTLDRLEEPDELGRDL